MRYLPHTEEEVREMLATIGVGDIDSLFATIPEAAQFRGSLQVPPSLAEPALMRHLGQLADKNRAAHMTSFLGCGAYAHHIPPAVDQLLLRSEFYTAYTPYQPEVAQGTLQAIWEFQTIVSELYGLPLANASLYDGASATAEGVLMARRLTSRDRVILNECVLPDYRQTVAAYLSGSDDSPITTVKAAPNGTYDLGRLVEQLSDQVACVVVGYPSFVGTVSDLRTLASACQKHGTLLIASVGEPYALALLESPGALGADIAAGEGQGLAVPPQFGGPGVGLFACRDDRKFLQQLPGRICGETVDAKGRRGYVLTLSTREQHIRRERATSNICTNQGLVALALTIRMSLLGKRGFVQVAEQCLAKAHYLRARLLELPKVSLAFEDAPFFNEFAIAFRGKTAQEVCRALEERGILAGVDLGGFDKSLSGALLIAVTENHTREELDALVNGIASLS